LTACAESLYAFPQKVENHEEIYRVMADRQRYEPTDRFLCASPAIRKKFSSKFSKNFFGWENRRGKKHEHSSLPLSDIPPISGTFRTYANHKYGTLDKHWDLEKIFQKNP